MGQNPAIARIRHHRNDLIIEVSHVVGFMGENYVETRCCHKDGRGDVDWIALGNNTTRTGYQLRRALDLQAQAICSHLGLKLVRKAEPLDTRQRPLISPHCG